MCNILKDVCYCYEQFMLWIKALLGKLIVGQVPNMESKGPLTIFVRARYWALC
jgi:hypothetical protein